MQGTLDLRLENCYQVQILHVINFYDELICNRIERNIKIITLLWNILINTPIVIYIYNITLLVVHGGGPTLYMAGR